MHNIKLTTLTIFNCTVQQHLILSHDYVILTAVHLQNVA